MALDWKPVLVGGTFYTVKAMRACCWLKDSGQMLPFAKAVFQAYWTTR